MALGVWGGGWGWGAGQQDSSGTGGDSDATELELLRRIDEGITADRDARAKLLARLDEQEKISAQQTSVLRRLLEEVRRLRGEAGDGSNGGAGTPFPPRRAEISIEDAPAIGPRDAPITIIEFSDFECPHCATMAPVLAKLRREYPGKIRIVFKHCPLPVHPNALAAHEASIAASRQGQFWEMHDLLYAHPDRLTENDLREYAKTLRLNLEQFDDDRTSDDVREIVQRDKAEASAARIGRVPTYFINGLKLEGAQSYRVMSAEVGTELARLEAEPSE